MKIPVPLFALGLAACGGSELEPVETVQSEVGALGNNVLTQATAGASVEAGDQLGRVLATGDFNGDSYEDLATSSPYEGDGVSKTGLVIIYYGGPDGIGSRGTERFNQSAVSGQTNESWDRFGWSLAAGNFNGDAYEDLAIGLPYEHVGGIADSGMVVVMFGSSRGLLPATSEAFTQSSVVAATNETNDHFGFALAAGNFNGDGYDDLAIGVPGEDTEGKTDTGMVAIMFGSRRGLLPSNSESFTQSRVDAATNERGDRFGFALAAGNFDGDRFDDLAVGVPYESTGGKTDTGMVAIMFGSSSGLLPSRNESFTQSSVAGVSNESYDRFGKVLTTGNLNGDAYDDLVIGVPYKDRMGASDAGYVAVMYGSARGLLPSTSEAVSQPQGYAAQEYGDRFGWAVTCADFDGDGFDDLVVGVPREDVDGHTDNGTIMAFFGSAQGVLPARSYWLRQKWFGGAEENGDQFGYALAAGDFNRDGHAQIAVGAPYEDLGSVSNAGAVFVSGLEPALPRLRSTRTAIVIDTNTAEVYGAKMPDKRRAMASTTKIMTALLTIEAIDSGAIRRTDFVTISANAAGTIGSTMNLNTGDRVRVSDLLYGLMLPSGNDVAIALAEFVGGDVPAFVASMNSRATRLGLRTTSYMNPDGLDPRGCDGISFNNTTCAHYSSARDLALLARFALSVPTFATVVGTESWTTTSWRNRWGTMKNGTLCNSNKRLRSGSGGCSSRSYYDPNTYGVKTGTTDDAQACLVAATTLNGRDVIAVVLGADRTTDDRYDDIADIITYGAYAP